MTDQTPHEPPPPTQPPPPPPPPQYQAAPQQGYAGPPVKAGNGLAVAGMVLGIIGIVFSFIPFLGVIFGVILGLLALIFGGVGLARSKDPARGGRGQAIAGIVLGILALVMVFVQGALINDAANELDRDLEELQEQLDTIPTEF